MLPLHCCCRHGLIACTLFVGPRFHHHTPCARFSGFFTVEPNQLIYTCRRFAIRKNYSLANASVSNNKNLLQIRYRKCPEILQLCLHTQNQPNTPYYRFSLVEYPPARARRPPGAAGTAGTRAGLQSPAGSRLTRTGTPVTG
jgi:hypothetical protein